MQPLFRIAISAAIAALSVSACTDAQAAEPELRVQEVQSGLEIPWDVAFLGNGAMLYTQRDRQTVTLRTPAGKSRVVLDSPTGMWSGGETGLMGIETAYGSTTDFLTCHGYRKGSTQDVRVVRWRLNAAKTAATKVKTLVKGLPSTSGRHGGCALVKGKGNVLYIGTGDAATGTNPQNVKSGGGKVLRVDARTGNAWKTNPRIKATRKITRQIYSYGHRNVQGLARRANGQIWSVEQGSSRDDEVNLLRKGGNYGWNPVPKSGGDPAYNESVPMTDHRLPGKQRSAAWRSGGSTIATSGGTFIKGAAWGELDGALAVAVLKDTKLQLFAFGPKGKLKKQFVPEELDGTYGRLRAAAMGPDGALYVTTSNGSNDKILRITPRV